MPFQSEKQRKYLWANEPEIARDWTRNMVVGLRKIMEELWMPGDGDMQQLPKHEINESA